MTFFPKSLDRFALMVKIDWNSSVLKFQFNHFGWGHPGEPLNFVAMAEDLLRGFSNILVAKSTLLS